MQAGHAALEAEFRHPIVDQKEVPQLRGRGTRNSAKRGHILIQGRAARAFPGPRPAARRSQPSDAWLFGVPAMQTRMLVERMALRRLSSHSRSGAGGVQTAKASRKQSSLSGKESAQGCIPKRLPGRPDEALGGGKQGPSAPAWARQHHRQRDPPFVPRKRLPNWASLELSPSVESCGCGLGPSPVPLVCLLSPMTSA